MDLQTAFLAEHVAVYEKKLNVLGGLIADVFVYQMPEVVSAFSLVLIVDLADEPYDVDQPIPLAIRVSCTDPDGVETNPIANPTPVVLKVGPQSFIYWRLAIHVERPGLHLITAEAGGQSVSTRLTVVDMRPDND